MLNESGPPDQVAQVAAISDIAAQLSSLPDADSDAALHARRRQDNLTKPNGSLGRLEDLACWLASWQGGGVPRADSIHVVVFAGDHGVAKWKVSAYPQAVTEQMVQNFIGGGAAINVIADALGLQFAVIPLRVGTPTTDFSEAPALSEAEFVESFNRGANAVSPSADILVVGEMGIGNTTAASAVLMALFGGAADEWVGPGTGVDTAGLHRKVKVVARSVALHKTSASDPLDILRRLGGRELAAIAGAVVRARLLRIPVILDGFIVAASVAPLFVTNERSLKHCVAGHVSAEPAHAKALALMRLEPLLALGMRLGEGSGAAVASALLKVAARVHTNMMTFEEAAVLRRGGG